jgi:hypothetical protein
MYYQPFFIELYAQCETDERYREARQRHRSDSGIVVRLIGVAAKATHRLSAAVERWATDPATETLRTQTSARAR